MSMLSRLSAAIILMMLGGVVSTADEASLKDGRSLQGHLSEIRSGVFEFVGPGAKSVPLPEIDQITFSGNVPPFHAGALHRVQLVNDQALTGEIITLDDRTLLLRTAWKPRLSIPRALLVSITHLADLVTVLDEDFEAESKGWKLTGSASIQAAQHTSGQKSLRLGAGEGVAEHVLATPIASGRLTINFHDPGSEGSRCSVDAEFAGQDKDRPVTVRVDGAGTAQHYRVTTSLNADESAPIRRTPGWHRLSFRFHDAYLFVGIDDAVTFASTRQGPRGSLARIRLVCAGGAESGGQVFFDDLTVASRVQRLSRPAGDAKQDELWLVHGDQVFGAVTGADRRTVELQARFGKRSYPWSELRGIYFQAPSPAGQTGGERIRFHSGAGEELDELEGTLVKLDDKQLRLRHAQLGVVDLDRARIRLIRPLR